MEFSRLQIARLVLGYLRSEKCHSAYEEFLESFPQLKETSAEKYITTRVLGWTLEDYLKEYAIIYTIVQGRLEGTDYFNRSSSRINLVEQLLYLLDRTNESSRASTPSETNPKNTSHDVGTNTNEDTPCSTASKCVNTDDLYHKETVDFEVLTQTLLEHHELHEKLAETINTVRNTPEAACGKKDVEKPNEELDSTIRTIVQKATSDPIFDKLIGEIIGSVTDDGVSSEDVDEPDHRKSPLKIPKSHNTSPSKPQTIDYTSTPIKSSIDEHNQDAVQSIIAVSSEKKQETKQSNVIVYDGSLEQYLKINTTSTSTTTVTAKEPDQVVNPINSSGLLMVNPTAAAPADKPNPYYILNSAPMNVVVSQPVITEQDIMAMPTVIVCDDKPNQNATVTQPILMTYPPPEPTKSIQAILPKPQTESITLYNAVEPLQACTILKNVKPRKIKPKVMKNRKAKTLNPQVLLSEGLKILEEKKSKEDKCAEEPKQQTPLECGVLQEGKKPQTPKSASHVRALDFSTPTKLFPFPQMVDTVPIVTQAAVDDNSSQKIIGVKPKKSEKKLSSWDADLRSLVSGNAEITTPKEPKPTNKKKKEKKKIEDVVQQITSSETPLKSTQTVKTDETPKIGETDQPDTSTKPEKPKPKSAKKQTGPKRPRKKCNADPVVTATTEVYIRETKKVDYLEDATNKLVLSPSKLNVNKRCLVDVSEQQPDTKLITPDNPKEPVSLPMLSSARKNVTPLLETPLKETVVQPPKLSGYLSPVTSTDTPFTRVLKEQLCGVDIGTINTPKFPITPSLGLTPCGGETGYTNRPTDYSSSSSYYQPSETDARALEQMMIGECHRLETKPKTPMKKQASPAKQEKVVILNEIRIPPKNIARKNLNLVKAEVDLEMSSSTSPSSSSSPSSGSSGSDDSKEGEVASPPVRRYSLRSQSAKKKATEVKGVEGEEPEAVKKKVERKRVEKGKEEEKKVEECKEVEVEQVNEEEKEKKEVKDDTQVIKDIISRVEVKTTLKRNSTSDVKNETEKLLSELEIRRRNTVTAMKAASTKSTPPVRRRPSVPLKKRVNSPTPKPDRPIMERVSRQTANKERILHISSDESQLDPFQLVETELLENSISSTPKHESNTEAQIISFDNIKSLVLKFEESRRQKEEAKGKSSVESNKMEKPETSVPKGVEPQKTHIEQTTTKESQPVSDQKEAENMVIGLKEWGIHLVPKTKSSSGKISVKSQQQDDSLEEGEVVSDSESKKKPERKSESRDRKSDSASKSKSRRDSDRERDKRKEHHRDRHSERKDRRNTDERKDREKQVKEKPKPETTQEITFDSRLYSEVISIEHDPEVKQTKTLEDYDLSVLDKKMNARVYIDSLDEEVEKWIGVTPFETLLEWHGKSRRARPVKVLMNEERTSGGVSNQSSPLTDLYEPDVSTGRYGRRNSREVKVENKGKRRSSKEGSVEEKSTASNVDDDLMNYALVGSERVENEDTDTQDRSSKKRKMTEDSGSQQQEKKKKTAGCQELLKKIDVENFLFQLHGEK